ncbi:MAG TPA: cytochrome c [Steroidobacteraceae bacterium]|jgi:mono/diheme cytochrome c family protein|nr:cytochrome c [Steroidobacteraceae bacterium]
MSKFLRNVAALTLLLVIGAPLGHTDAAPAAADASLIQRGQYLAYAADCVACHSVPGGAAYAGGRGMGLPLGTVYTTNITPDPQTGIGRYSLQDFDRAVRAGVARDGHRLYPSMPYPSYAKISDGDVAALYAYFMKAVKPVHQANRPAQIPWYLNIRWALPVWNLLFVENGSFQATASHDAQWNRGAYLVQGLGHCGACHTPRGWLFEEEALTQNKRVYLSGASLDSWSAADLDGDATYGLGRWSEADLVQFFKTGHNAGGTAFGSMIDVINYSTQYLTDADNAAIAHYLKSLPPAHPDSPQNWSYDPATAAALVNLQFKAPGSLIYYQYCASCHQRDGKGQAPFIPALAGNPAVIDSDPVSLINITLNGSSPIVVAGDPDYYRMVSFRGLLDDRQVADVLSFMRGAWGNGAAAVTPGQVAALRTRTDAVHVEELNLLRMR